MTDPKRRPSKSVAPERRGRMKSAENVLVIIEVNACERTRVLVDSFASTRNEWFRLFERHHILP